MTPGSRTGLRPDRRFTKIIYIDVNTEYRIDGQAELLDNIAALNNQISNLFNTVPEERGFEPTFGSQIPYLLFDPCDDETAWNIETAMFYATGQWLADRLTLATNKCRVIADRAQGLFDAKVVYNSPLADEVGLISLDIQLPSMYIQG